MHCDLGEKGEFQKNDGPLFGAAFPSESPCVVVDHSATVISTTCLYITSCQ